MIDSMEKLHSFMQSRDQYGIKPGLDRVEFLLQKTNHPERAVKAVHVAGTNGKGSTIQFLQDALIHNHYRVSVFTSPSFSGISGHFLINGKPVTESSLIFHMNELLPFIYQLDQQENHPTEFEILTVLAFLCFRGRVDIALIETGMGGRFDTTNCFVPILSIITNVTEDHINYLGPTLNDIAHHKAGIIKRQIPVVTGRLSDGPLEVIRREAKEQEADIYRLQEDFFIKKNKDQLYFWMEPDTAFPLTILLHGRHQIENAAVSYMALHLLRNKGFKLDDLKLAESFRQTVLPGRFEKISHSPFIIADSAHNIAGIQAFIRTVEETDGEDRKRLIFAGFQDKNLQSMLQQLVGKFDHITVTTFSHKRAAPIDFYKKMPIYHELELVKDWKRLIDTFFTGDFHEHIYITGSLHFITMVRNYINAKIVKR